MKAEKKYRGPCPCGSRQSYERCCQRWHDGEVPADAEALMRSRYAAFVLKIEEYLLASWHSSTRPLVLDLASSPRRWLGLKVLRHEAETPDTAIVEFIARYKASGRGRELHETSRFVREHGRWLYVDGGAEDA
ncbi:MAG: YchJ family protein [Rhodomicrobium sp.]